jgi:glutamyl/glutaminyl-tRNA synthetase
VPLLLNPDRSKMSKRHGDVMVRDFITKGYFPQALVNYVALCGWNPGTEQEKFSMDELIAAYSLERVSKAGAIFDYKKLDWMNSQYLGAADPAALAQELHPLLVERGYAFTDIAYVTQVVALLRERVTFLRDLVEFGDYLFSDTLVDVDTETWSALKNDADLVKAIAAFRQGLNEDALASVDAFKTLANEAAASAGLKMGKMMKPLRLVVTHREVGAELYDTIKLLGVDRCLLRIDSFLVDA